MVRGRLQGIHAFKMTVLLKGEKMEREKIEFWTFGSENGKIIINFDKETKYIEIDSKDIRSMVSWLMMDSGTYKMDWDKGLFE